ncbi:MAG: hypothetical protein AAFV53_03230 [Myxococcota bacterium]
MLMLIMAFACAGGDTSEDDTSEDTAIPDGDLELSPGFAVETVAGTAEGEEELTTCAGWFPRTPQHQMRLEASMTGMYLEADTDAVVLRVIFSENGSEFCSDLDSGLPRVERGSWSSGVYEVYVGTPGPSGSVAYVLTAYE